jgi:hypothetical protein
MTHPLKNGTIFFMVEQIGLLGGIFYLLIRLFALLISPIIDSQIKLDALSQLYIARSSDENLFTTDKNNKFIQEFNESNIDGSLSRNFN